MPWNADQPVKTNHSGYSRFHIENFCIKRIERIVDTCSMWINADNKSSLYWNVMLCSPLKVIRCFERTYRKQSFASYLLHWRWWHNFSQKHQLTLNGLQWYIPNDWTLHNYCCENLKFYKTCFCFPIIKFYQWAWCTFSVMQTKNKCLKSRDLLCCSSNHSKTALWESLLLENWFPCKHFFRFQSRKQSLENRPGL